MGKKVYVGNLPFSASDSSLNQLFAQHGTVTSSQVIIDRETGRSKGFGFVEMSTEEEAANVIENLNGSEHDGRALKVNEAKPKASGDAPRRQVWNDDSSESASYPRLIRSY